MLPILRHRLDGPPFALPRPLDRAAERWWAARARTRMLAGLSVALVLFLAGVAHAASNPQGPPRTVWVAARDLHPGDQVTAADVERRSWPEDLVPAGILDHPRGLVTAPLPRGAVVTDRHLGETGIASTLPPDRVAVAVPAGQLPSLTPGMALDLVGPGPEGAAVRVGTRATVVAADGEVVWLAIDPEAVLGVSAAVASGTLVAVVLPS